MSDAESDGATALGGTTFHPSIKVPLVKIVVGILLGAAVLGGLIGAGAAQDGVVMLLLVLVGLYVLNKLVRIVVLRHTEYVLTDEVLRKEFSLFFRKHRREIPTEKIRGVELNRGMVATLVGYGSVVVLTAGPNRSLGFLNYDHVPEPETRLEDIKRLMLD